MIYALSLLDFNLIHCKKKKSYNLIMCEYFIKKYGFLITNMMVGVF